MIATSSNGKKLQVQETTPRDQIINALDWAKQVAEVAPGETAVIINGRVMIYLSFGVLILVYIYCYYLEIGICNTILGKGFRVLGALPGP